MKIMRKKKKNWKLQIRKKYISKKVKNSNNEEDEGGKGGKEERSMI